MTSASRYDSANIPSNIADTPTSEQIAKRREAVGRAIEQLGTACARKGVDFAIVQTSLVGKPARRISITNQRTGERISVHGELLDVIDTARDRLNREDWDR
ncbi:hypothetical protein SEA_DELIAN_51 [Gordonia phage Delian]|uniref:hypothetical protein n=1 Tax=Gordonia phage CaptainKirk2 TaxID=1887643 RepID=UPI00084EE6BA|nr:hypothetical protein BIZ76_gp48 [Gordonia phage CaptainKirk2]AXH67473.1 hypothetical protein SEA_ZARBODNAMRA_47 [Gordonia phage Zarbodnamra]QBG78521.1 hypothetical protein SEA_BARCO_46 [Gordonia phage Barco]QDB74551.1 hypothetical protein SEA_MELBA_47 [Gordonia phage Melba]QDH85369.1 hypothetical protein SEA_MINTFEN_48 [Gordonia phage MintFen]QGH77971.1 hypothetical protein SEA_DELIAN_51 [Gordonia phage Delian]QKO02366.1 hypothetical protein SEA_BLINGBLING_45 [Gordonia phage BlingBling]QN